METRVAVISIIIEDSESVQAINELLHEYGGFIIGRMGIPYREKKLNIIHSFFCLLLFVASAATM